MRTWIRNGAPAVLLAAGACAFYARGVCADTPSTERLLAPATRPGELPRAPSTASTPLAAPGKAEAPAMPLAAPANAEAPANAKALAKAGAPAEAQAQAEAPAKALGGAEAQVLAEGQTGAKARALTVLGGALPGLVASGSHMGGPDRLTEAQKDLPARGGPVWVLLAGSVLTLVMAAGVLLAERCRGA